MDVCGDDPAFEAYWGDKNETTYQTIQRCYEGFTDRIYKPARLEYDTNDVLVEGFVVSSFELRVTPPGPEKLWKKKSKLSMEVLNLACHYYEPELDGELAIFGCEVESLRGDEKDRKDDFEELYGEQEFNRGVEEDEDSALIGFKSVNSQLALDRLLLENANTQKRKSIDEDEKLSEADAQEEDKSLFLSDTIIVYIHTNTANSLQAQEILPLCKRLNTGMVCYDLRGHGKSCGQGIVRRGVATWGGCKSAS